MGISKLYDEYFNPYKNDYLFIGGLIIFLGFIQQVFKDNIFKSFLLGASLFLVSCLFIGILFKLWKKEIFDKKDAHLLDSFFVFLYPLFVFAFFLLSYLEYPEIFSSFLGIGFGLILLSGFSEIRRTFIILRNKIQNKNLRLILRVFTFLTFFVLLILYSHYTNIHGYGNDYMYENNSDLDITKLNNEGLFWVFTSFFAGLGLFFLNLLSLIEIFREEKKNKKMNWKNLKSYDSIISIRNNFKKLITSI